MRASSTAFLLLCSQLGGQAYGQCKHSDLVSSGRFAQGPVTAVAIGLPGERGEITYSMSYAVVEEPARFKMLLVASDESVTYPMLVLP